MAYSLNIGDIVEVTLKGTIMSQQVMNILHYKYAGTAAIADGTAALQSLLTNLRAANKLVDKFLASCGSNYVLDEMRAQVVHPTRQVYTIQVVGSPGTHAQTAPTANLSATIVKTPDQAGHGRTGTFHVPGLPDGTFTGGALVGAYKTILQGLGDEIKAQTYGFGTPSTAQAIIWSRVKPTTPSVILGYRINDYVRTMHRRTVGLGI